MREASSARTAPLEPPFTADLAARLAAMMPPRQPPIESLTRCTVPDAAPATAVGDPCAVGFPRRQASNSGFRDGRQVTPSPGTRDTLFRFSWPPRHRNSHCDVPTRPCHGWGYSAGPAGPGRGAGSNVHTSESAASAIIRASSTRRAPDFVTDFSVNASEVVRPPQNSAEMVK